jgi:hypothetical protein
MIGDHARLGMNPMRYYSWKGQTLSQITSVFKMNSKNGTTNDKSELRKALPIVHYRKEIANLAGSGSRVSCSRNSLRISDFEKPGSSIVNSSNVSQGIVNNGLVNTLYISQTTLSSENPGNCTGCTSTTSGDPFSPAENAKKRVRSAGMIRRKFNPDKNNDKYYTSTNEYLVSRNRAIGQRDYIYFRNSNSGVQPGTGNAKSNIYSYTGLSHCTLATISPSQGNNTFSYLWVDENEYPVTIPTGSYDVESLNNAFKQSMITNGHYFINNLNQSKNFLLSLDYNGYDNTIIVNSTPASKRYPFNTLTGGSYSTPIGATWYSGLDNDDLSNTFFKVNTAGFSNLIGVEVGQYSGRTVSTRTPQIAPRYDTLYYKPNNIIFGQQGAVDSSTYTHREKYNTVNKGGYLAKSAFGSAVGNAMAYGVSEQPRTLKQITGYQNTSTPVIKPNEDCVRTVSKFIYRRG